MRIWFRGVLLLGLVLSFDASSNAADPDGLVLTLESAQSAYAPDEPLLLRACVTNRGRKARFLYRKLSDGVKVWPYDSAGNPISPAVVYGCVIYPPQSADLFVALEPRHSLCIDQEFPSHDLSLDRPGKYTLVAQYISDFPASWALKYLGLTIWDGEPFSSDPVPVEILAPRSE